MKKIMGIMMLVMLICLINSAYAVQGLTHLQLKAEQRIYTAPSDDAWVTGRPGAGQVMQVQETSAIGDERWARVSYRDQITRMLCEGWLHCTENVMPYDLLISEAATPGAEAASRQRLEQVRKQMGNAAPDYIFEKAYVGEAFLAQAEGIVCGEMIWISVDVEAGFTAEHITHFIVMGEDGLPAARLNAVDASGAAGMSIRFEGAADYLPGTGEIILYPVCEGQTEIDYARCMMLVPEGAMRRDPDASDAVYRMTGRPHKSLPQMIFTFEDTGALSEEDEHILRLIICDVSGAYRQELTYRSYENGRSLGLARLEDANFDGYLDLVLAHALGASNWYAVIAPWLPEQGRFAEVNQGVRLCNHVVYPVQQLVLSTEKDGAASYYSKVYGWDDGALILRGESVMENTMNTEAMHERVVRYHEDGTEMVLWDDIYPVEWYDGGSHVWNERRDTIDAVLIHGTRGHHAVVDHVDWVNLRRQDSKQSPSIARLDAGTEVEVLSYGCGEDRGWIRVLTQADGKMLTGYIWKTYLRDIR